MDNTKKLLDDMLKLNDAMNSDLVIAIDQLSEDSCQYNTRVLFSTAFRVFEGIIFSFKNAALDLHENLAKKIIKHKCKAEAPETWDTFKPRLSYKEVVLLREQNISVDDKGVVRTSPIYLTFEKNLRMSFNLFLKVINSDYCPDYSDNKFDCLKKSVLVRNRIVHPKNSVDLDISVAEVKKLFKGKDWIFETRIRLMQELGKSIKIIGSEVNKLLAKKKSIRTPLCQCR